jgi:hypothetical protein
MRLLLFIILCNPLAPIGHAVKAVGHGIKHVAVTAFYKTTNFFVDHIQPNYKGEPGCH